jgi:hypothetical protein
MKHSRLTWIAGTTLGLALVIGGCEKKSEELAPPPATSQAPMPEKSTADQPTTSQAPTPDTGMTGSTQGQKPEESKEARKG